MCLGFRSLRRKGGREDSILQPRRAATNSSTRRSLPAVAASPASSPLRAINRPARRDRAYARGVAETAYRQGTNHADETGTGRTNGGPRRSVPSAQPRPPAPVYVRRARGNPHAVPRPCHQATVPIVARSRNCAGISTDATPSDPATLAGSSGQTVQSSDQLPTTSQRARDRRALQIISRPVGEFETKTAYLEAARRIHRPCRILDLPAELRELIFELVVHEERFAPSFQIDLPDSTFHSPVGTINRIYELVNGHLIGKPERPDMAAYFRHTPLTQVNKQFRRESLPLYLKQRTMLLDIRSGPVPLAAQILPDLERYRSPSIPWYRLGENFEFRIFRRGAQSSPKLTIEPQRSGGHRVQIWHRTLALRYGRLLPEWIPRPAPSTMLSAVQHPAAADETFLTPRDIAVLCIEFCWYWQSGLLGQT